MSWLGKVTSDDGRPLSLAVLSVFTFMGAAVVAAAIFATKKLKRVGVEDGFLCVSNYFTEVRVPLSEVGSVREYGGISAAMGELVQYGWRFFRNLFLPKAVLAARVLAAESQLAVCQERLESQGVRRHRFSESFRWLWILLSGGWEDWPRYARLMQPATVKRWHEWGFRLFWRWKSSAVRDDRRLPRN